MRKLRYAGLGIVILAAALIGLYFYVTYEPWAPSRNWPVLQTAEPARDAAHVTVGQNVHISASLDQFGYWECVLAAHPADATQLTTAVMHWRGEAVDIASFYSSDGGATWQLGCDLPAPTGKKFFDPAVAFGPDGTAYLVHMHDELNDAPFGSVEGGHLQFHASPDGGKTWEKRAVVAKYIDRPWIAVDSTTGPHSGTLYCIGNINEPIFFTSSDGAKTVSPLLTPRAEAKPVSCDPANPVVMPDGTLLLAHSDRYVTRRPGKSWPRPLIDTIRSTDGGRTLTRSTPIDTKWWHDKIRSNVNDLPGKGFPQLAADPGSRRLAGRVYLVWTDGSNAEATRVFFSASPDAGETWGRPVVISEQPMEADVEAEYAAFVPCIAVNNEGVIAVSWYDRRGLPKSRKVSVKLSGEFAGMAATERVTDGWNLRLRMSRDGGATWLPSVQLNEQPSRGEVNVGHTAGLVAAADGRFHAAWIDSRTGQKQLWTASIDVMLEK